jgi:hypothetical protein
MNALALAWLWLAPAALAPSPPPARDGARDFDFAIGTWRTQVSRLQRPLTGSRTWVRYEGTSEVHALWDGRANLVELDVSGPAGRIEGVSLRLYNPETGQWSLNYANRAGGVLTPPVIGAFNDGRGEFYGQEIVEGRPVFARFVVFDITADSCRFEQAFSSDGGRTWEVNWIATDTRVKESPRSPGAVSARRPTPVARAGRTGSVVQVEPADRADPPPSGRFSFSGRVLSRTLLESAACQRMHRRFHPPRRTCSRRSSPPPSAASPAACWPGPRGAT